MCDYKFIGKKELSASIGQRHLKIRHASIYENSHDGFYLCTEKSSNNTAQNPKLFLANNYFAYFPR